MRVRGKGPVPCDLMFVGEAPGIQEDRRGEPFVGKTGEEIDRHLSANGLPARSEIFLTNLYREYRGKDYEYTAADLEADEPELVSELQRVRATTIVPLGRAAARWFLGDVDIQAVQGLPYQIDGRRWGSSECICLPLVHPAAGLRNSEMSPYVVSGFAALADYLAGRLAPRRLYDDPIKQVSYEEITSESDLAQVLSGLQAGQNLAIDTEGWFGAPWSLQFSYQPGRSYAIGADRKDLFRAFADCARRIRPVFLYHSALHDLGMLRALGIDVEGLPFDDTMIELYLLQLEPQGLKAACLRHCNMRMDDYAELVAEPDKRLAQEYLTWLWEGEQVAHEEACQREFDARKAAGRRIRKVPTLPKSALHKATERCLRSDNPRKLWGDQVEDIQVAGYAQHGEMPVASLDYVPRRVAVDYGCRDADGTLRLAGALAERIDALGLRGVYELELSTYPFIDRMQRAGVRPDLEHFAELSGALAAEIDSLRQELVGATGREGFNANSGDQVADYLFGQLGLDEIKRTSSGRGSTNDKVLEALEREHPEVSALPLIRSYRETYKLLHTFVLRLPDFVDRWPHDGRIHCNFRTTRVVTGRLAASDPNLLAQPEHGKFAKDFKRGWVAEPGHMLVQLDMSQIELRVLAHLSQDPTLLAIYRGEMRNQDGSLIDVHARTAQGIFNVPPAKQDKSKHRLPAKAVNFMIPMGATKKGLSVELRKNGIDAYERMSQEWIDEVVARGDNPNEEMAQQWLDDTLDTYPGVRRYMACKIEEARRNGYVRCLSGRIRYIGGIHSRDDRVREEAERFAFSTPIQEGAQALMKRAEARMYREVFTPLWKRGEWAEPILQVHDAIKAECAEHLVRELHDGMAHVMTDAPDWFSLPLAVEGEVGRTFADMERL